MDLIFSLIRRCCRWLWSEKTSLVAVALQLEAIALLVFTEAVVLVAMYAAMGLFLHVGLGSSRSHAVR